MTEHDDDSRDSNEASTDDRSRDRTERLDFGRRTILEAAAGVAAVGFVPPASARPQSGERLHVGVEDDVGEGGVAERVRAHASIPDRAEVVDFNDTLNIATVELPEAAAQRAQDRVTRAMSNQSGVRYAERIPEPTHFVESVTAVSTNDPRSDEQWAEETIDAPTAWETTQASLDTTVAIVDTGLQWDHPDLVDRFTSDKGGDDPRPGGTGFDHGTHCAGCASATTGNGTGIAAPSNSRLLGYAHDKTGTVNGIQEAVDDGADVISMSWGYGPDGGSQATYDALKYAYDNGVTLVAAAGNSGGQSTDYQVSYPAARDEVIAVGASNQNDEVAYFSSYGPEVDVVAPGTDVLSTIPGGYSNASGTSMATPTVAGVVALATELDPSLGPEDIRELLRQTAVDIGESSDRQGAGRIDAAAIVEAVDGSGGGGGGGDGQPPTASIGTVEENYVDWIRLDASGSSDPDGGSLSYQWSITDGEFWTSDSDTAERPWIDISNTDRLTATLTVTDDEGQTDTTDRTFDVGGSDGQPPTASIGTVDENYEDWIRLDASGSNDPDGGSLSYQWSITDGEFWTSGSDTAEQPWIDISNTDELTATLTVTDDEGQTDTADRTFDFGGGGGGSGPGTNTLLYGADNELVRGEHLESSNGDYRLYVQDSDGNLVLRATTTGDAKWAAGTAGDGGTQVKVQGDGNFVMYTDGGDAVWASNTAGSGADELVLEDDGSLVLYDDGSSVWTVNE